MNISNFIYNLNLFLSLIQIKLINIDLNYLKKRLLEYLKKLNIMKNGK